ncbi:MAG: molybdenum cofactor guanylyltransferase [Acidobacteriota bacterium]
MTTAAILAGGRARRLGGLDKGLLNLGGRTIVEWQLEAVREVVQRVVIVSNETGKYAALGVPVVADVVAGAGSLGGILTALSVADGESVLVLACDMPFVSAAFLDYVRHAGRDADVALPRTDEGRHPLCACYAQTCADPIRRCLEAGELRVLDVITSLRVRDITGTELSQFDPHGLLLLNVNTPDDYARALAHERRLRR